MAEADAEPEVTAYVVDPTEGMDLRKWQPGDDMTETQKAAFNRYVAAQSGAVTQEPNAFVSDYETTQAFALAGALAPPEDPRAVANIYRRSSALRPCVESVATNTVGAGYAFEPVIDLDKKDAAELIRDAILQDRIVVAMQAPGNPDPDVPDPTDADIAETRARIERGMLREKFRLERFFSHCCPSRAFTQLRWMSRVERESGGNAYWEVTRKSDRSIHTWDRVEAHTMRLRRQEENFTKIQVNQRRSPLAYERVEVPVRFRTYVQLVLGGAKAVYFKQYGDPRVLSSETGRFYHNAQMLSLSEGHTPPATEIIHWSAFDAIGPYGLPQWYGAQYAVMGLLASERVNYDYFGNKAIPPFAIFVSGGKLKGDAVAKIKEVIKSIKGEASFWKILVLEAETSGEGKCKIELHPLLQAMPEDALFQQYEANNAKKIQQQWRLPDLLVGRSQEVNRAQADAVLEMAEQQVIQPRRDDEDDFYNRFVLPEMGILWWRFRTNSADPHDPELQTKLATQWMTAGAMKPNEGRAIMGDVFNKEYAVVDEPWANIPQPLALAGIMPAMQDGKTQPVTAQQQTLVQQIIATRDKLRANAQSGAVDANAAARAQIATRTVKVAQADWDSMFER